MQNADASRFSISLAQGSEFGFVLIGIALGLNLLSSNIAGLLTAVIALSMASAALLMMFDDKFVQPWLGQKIEDREADAITHDGVDAIIAGHGRFGMTVGRVLAAQGLKTTLLDHDSSQVDALRKFGFKVFYGDALRTDLLEAAGANEAKILVIAIDDREKITELVRVAQLHFPKLQLLVRAYDRTHAGELLKIGVQHVYREMFGSSMNLAKDALIVLGQSEKDANSVVKRFSDHDEKFLRKSVAVRDDQNALQDLARESRAEIARVFAADREKPEGNT
jgi:voltage-gated potassium channel Kch